MAVDALRQLAGRRRRSLRAALAGMSKQNRN
jgi:hypothetical protein